MEDNSDQNYITLSENEDFSDNVTEITPVLLARKKRGHPAKSKQKTSVSEETNQESLRKDRIILNTR